MTTNPLRKVRVRIAAAGLWAAFVFLGIDAASFARPALADTVHLKRGGTLEGKVVEKEATVDVLVNEGTTTFNKTDIASIDKSPVHNRNSWQGKWEYVKSLSASLWSKAKRKAVEARYAFKKKTDGWSKPVGYKKENPNSIKAISAQEKKRIS